jgi:hypothetical protein
MILAIAFLLLSTNSFAQECDVVFKIAQHASAAGYEESLLFYVDSKIDDAETSKTRDITIPMPRLSASNMNIIIEEYASIGVSIRLESGNKYRVYWCQPEIKQFTRPLTLDGRWYFEDGAAARLTHMEEQRSGIRLPEVYLGQQFVIHTPAIHF